MNAKMPTFPHHQHLSAGIGGFVLYGWIIFLMLIAGLPASEQLRSVILAYAVICCLPVSASLSKYAVDFYRYQRSLAWFKAQTAMKSPNSPYRGQCNE